jgi:HAD superfamily hydrolase (TIGR01509 family)
MFDPDLIIFDCDGTLVDSELLHNTATSQILTELGHPHYTPEYCMENFVGAGQSKVWERVQAETGDIFPTDVNNRFIDRVAQLQDGLVRPVPGAQAVLDSLHGRIKICVGSNGEPENVRGVLGACALLGYFNDADIFTARDVPRPKPAPDLFLHAAEKMGANPARCLVIEDSVAGATAGVAAGMRVIGYTGVAHDRAARHTQLESLQLDIVIDDLADMMRLVAIRA